MKRYLILIALAHAALASAVVAPGAATIDAGRVTRQLQNTQLKPQATGEVDDQTGTGRVTSAELEKVRFILSDIELEGNTHIDAKTLRERYADKLGQEISLADLYTIREGIASVYRSQGYILTKVVVPEQSFDQKGAKIKMQVIEGFIENLRVEGDINNTVRRLIMGYLKRVREYKPTKVGPMEHYALLANELAGHKVRFVLSPSAKTTGAADLTAIVEKARGVDVQLMYDNFGTILLGPEQFTGAVYFNAPFGTADRFGVRSTVTLDAQRLQYYQLSNQHPLNTRGTRLNMYGSFTRTNPGEALLPLDVRGNSRQGIISVVHPWLRSRKKNLYTNFDFEALNNQADLRQADLAIFKDRIRSLRIGVTYDEIRWRGVSLVAGRISQGLDSLGARSNGAPNLPLSRPMGKTSYTKFEGDLVRTQFITDRWSYYGAVHGQYSLDPLLSAEQMGVGGSVFGRGFDNSEIIGDRGYSLKNEIRYDITPKNQKYVQLIQPFGFYDIGTVWNINSDNFPSRKTIASAGAGFRATFSKYLFIETYLATPVINAIVSRENSRQPRYLLNIVLMGE